MKERHLPLRMPSKSNSVLGLKIAVIAATTLVIFYQDLATLVNDGSQSEFTSYILAIPFLFAYLIYRKRKMLRAVIPFEKQDQPKETRHLPTIAGIILSATAILLYWHGSHTFTPLEYHMFAFPIFIAGLTLIIFNPQMLRQLAFPLAFLTFLTPPPSEILYALQKYAKPIKETLLLPVLNYTKKDSILSSKMELEAESRGMPIRRTDAMIAAITINNGATLYTFDLKHFSPLKSLNLKLFHLTHVPTPMPSTSARL
jgi:hypothetical protein